MVLAASFLLSAGGGVLEYGEVSLGEAMADGSMRIAGLDHLVLTVTDIEATCAFYERVLGMRSVTFGEGRRALEFGQQKINLHLAGHELEPKAARPTPGSADLCFIVETALPDVIAHLRACGILPELGPVDRTGAAGATRSIYLRDPDRNLIELSSYVTNEHGRGGVSS